MLATLLACFVALASGDDQDGALAPADAWVTHGGSPARNRASATRALFVEPHLGWTFEAPGPIEGDPLVWGGRAFVAYRTKKGRGLAVLDLRDGSTLERLTFASAEAPLAPCVWGDLLLVRDDELRAYRVGTRGLSRLWTRTADAAHGPPLLVRDEIYVVDGDALLRLRAADGSTLWRTEGLFHGRPSLRGERVYVPGRAGDRIAIDTFERASGKHVGHLIPAPAPGGLPDHGDPGGAYVAAFADELVVYVEQPIDFGLGRTTRSVATSARRVRAEREGVPTHWLFHRVDAAETPGGWIGSIDDLWFLSKGDKLVPLATGESHPSWVTRTEAPARAGRAAYFAGAAFDHASHLVLWRLDEPALGPMIPARGCVLVVRADDRLEAWRTREPVRASGLAFGAVRGGGEGARIADARAVLDDGSVEAGDFLIEERKGERMLVTVRRAGSSDDLTRHQLHPIAKTQLVLGADDRVIWAADPAALLRGVDALIDEQLGADYAQLAIDALPARDYELVAAIVERARACGVSEADLRRATRLLERSAGEGATNRRDDEAAPIEARLAELDRRRPDRYCAIARALPADDHELRYALLRPALLADPAHAASLAALGSLDASLRVALLREVASAHPGAPAIDAAVRALLPDGLAPADPLETLDWLAYLEATVHTPVAIHEPRPPSVDLGPGERKLGSAALHWRPDVKGFASENLFVITPVARPGALARCLSLGELVCDVLDEMFAGGAERRDERFPLYVHLFETQKEYLAHSENRGGGHLSLGWTAGHYDNHENVSRLFLPTDDESFEEVTRTFVHELTHQWVRNRCPLFTNEEAVLRLHQPPTGGHWIVEGFASLVEELTFDPAARTWTHENPTSRRRDLVTSADPAKLLPWDVVLAGDARDFLALDKSPSVTIPLRTRLGMISPTSATALYYAQAQTMCYYLWAAEDGARRAALLEYLAAYYRGDDAGLDVEKAFGMTARELGERALAYARESMR